MINIRYAIGSKAHVREFANEAEFIKWFKEHYDYKIIDFKSNSNSIELKDLNLSGITPSEELNKVNEENYEFELAVLECLCNENYDTKNHAIEEFWDKVQSSLSYLQLTLGITADEVMKYYSYHLEKIKNRPR